MRFPLLLLIGLLRLSSANAQAAEWHYKAKLDSLLRSKSAGAQNPGFAVCIVDHGNIVYEFQTGMANLKTGKPIGTETMFNIGSITKQFTATCILLLEEQGKLKRSDPVQKYIPELPDFGHLITIDHLIAHMSGLHSHMETISLRRKFKNSQLDASNVFSFYQKAPVLAFEPGTDFAYNNTAYMLLCMIVERVSGMLAAEFMEKQIFQPLGMHATNFTKVERMGLSDGTVSYTFQERKNHYKKDQTAHNALGATGVHSTLRDMVKWQDNFDHNRLGKGSPALIQKMEAMYTLVDGTPVHYGTGLFIKNYRGIPVIEHGGGWNSFLMQCRRFPKQRISILVASNNDRTSPFPIADLICDNIFNFNPLPPKRSSNLDKLPIPASALEGLYLSFNNRLRRLQRSGDTLQITFDESPKKTPVVIEYVPEASSDTSLVFMDPVTGYPLLFSLGKDRRVRGFYWEGGDYFQCRRFFEKLDDKPVSPEKWAGNYYAPDFRQKIGIRRKGAGLRIKPVLFLSYPLDPVTGSVYKVRGERIIVRFSENGLVLGHDWVSNLQFSKR